MFEFIKLQYQMKNITEEQVKKYSTAGLITETQAVEITAEDIAHEQSRNRASPNLEFHKTTKSGDDK